MARQPMLRRRHAHPDACCEMDARVRRSAAPEARVLRGGEVDAHQRARPRARHGTGCPARAASPGRAGPRPGVRCRTPVSTQPNSPCGGAAKTKPAFGGADGTRTRQLQPLHHALDVAAQQALLQAMRQRALGQRRRGQCRSAAWCRPAGRPAPAVPPGSRRASSAPGSSRSRRCRTCAAARPAPPAAAGAAAPGGRRCRPRRCAARAPRPDCSNWCARCSDSEAPVGLCSTDTVTYRRGLVRHRSIAASRPGRARPRRAAPAARACPARQPRVLHRPAGLVDQHRVAGPQQRARHHVQRLRRADGGDDLLAAPP